MLHLSTPKLPRFDRDMASEGAAYDLDREVDLELLIFDHLQSSDVDITGARLANVAFDSVHLASMSAGRADWMDVIVSGRIGALDALDARWRSIHFHDCKFDYVNLRGAELIDVTFTNCLIGELDLLQANLRRVRFTNTEVSSLSARQSRLREVDLRGASLGHIDGLMELSGATISAEQAYDWAALFAREAGIQIA